ncbi:MAG: tetratricopeptide repeat-containing protein, partial [Vicinamibacterales bacterium]
PLFAQADLYVDFGDSPEGPRGVNLLRLLCGMRGFPLEDGAVRMAHRIVEESRQTMTLIRGAIEAGNGSRLRELGLSNQMGVLSSPTLMSAAAQGLIRLGEYDKALEVSRHALECFPKSIRAKQLKGLALRRLKRFQEAIDVLSELKADGHQDPETLGILAAAWDGLYLESGKALHLRRARELYRTAFQADPKDSYTGINAAAKSLFLGERDEAARLAAAVRPLVAHAADGEDFWPACTLGEVFLLQRQLDEAAAQYQRVIDRHPVAIGDLKSTEQQARRICIALELSPGETAAALAPFGLLSQ